LDDVSIDLIPDEAEDALCEGMDETTGGVLSCEDYGEITSFTEYEGSFEAPDAEGYDSGLTKATSAREFVLNVTNFALSFLGLLAVVIIIYGGFLYITAGGEEDKSGKGKKAIMYAVIGIIVVLSSYAIVNTLIGEAPGGGEDRGGGIYSSGDAVTGDEVDIYNVNQIAEDVKNITTEYVDIFTIYSNVYTYVEYIESYDAPEAQEVTNLLEWMDGNDEAEIDYDSLALINEYADIVGQVAVKIMDSVDRYSDTYTAAQNLQEYADILMDNTEPSKYSYDSTNYLANLFGIKSVHAATEEFDITRYRSEINDLIDAIRTAANNDFDEKMQEYYDILDGYKALFESVDGTTLSNIVSQFNTVTKHFAPAGDSRQNSATIFIANSVLRDVVDDLGTLYSMVLNLEFVTAVIEASVDEGNSPLVVSFNGLQSYDPSDLSITDDNYSWDLNGDSKYGQEPEEESKATVSYTYTSPGTYRVGLRVTSASREQIAPGQSYITIIVNPPKSNIYITASASGDPEGTTLADYKEGISEDDVIFTESAGAAGITISLEGTEDGNGDPTVYHKLDCGNGTETYESENLITEICTYPEGGVYELEVEVTDIIGNIDRYIGDIIIASPAARADVSSNKGKVGDTFTMDSSLSSTDKGVIESRKWSVVLPDGSSVDLGDAEQVEYKPDTPGKYAISLEVTDSSDNSNTDTTYLMIESQAPVPKLSYNVKNLSQPGTIYFDAGDSYDPDPDDTLSYLWTFEGTEGEDYTFIEGDATSESPVVKFKSAGAKTVTLEVSDQYEDDDIRKTSTFENKIEVESVLDVLLELPDGIAHTIDEETGEVEVTFNAVSDNAVAFEIDYGDSENEMSDTISGGTSTFTHTYKEAGTYQIMLTAYDEEDNENTYTKKLYIGDSSSTIAVVGVLKDDIDISTSDISGSIKTVFTFDASESKNKDGSSRNLEYSWDFGDNTRSTDKKAKHTFEEVGTYEVTLTVTDEDDPKITSEDTIQISIAEEPPVIKSLTYTINSDSNVTPVEVTVEVDAEDPDGTISNYSWYYYDTSDTTEKLGAKITKTNKADITISTNGTTGEEKEYAFVVEVTDSANNKASSVDFLDEDPTIEVENGENASPIAEFSVSDTQIMLGDSVTLSSTSYDPDGDDLTHVWDLEGNGFSDNEETEDATFNFAPTVIGCYDIRLKVVDTSNQAATSDGTTQICVESIAEPPEAAFTYKVDNFDVIFTNNSKVDTANGAEFYAFYWDFDIATDSDGNGDPADDTDSDEESPTYIYETTGTYEVKLTVYDNSGNSDEVTQSILISDTEPPTAAFTYEVDGLSVAFADNSETSSSAVSIVSYSWDFDSLKDTDGDGDKTNDMDSTSATPEHEYDDYGTYTVKLTVMDSVNKEDYVTRTVEVTQEEALIGYLGLIPELSQSDSKIHLEGTSGTIDIPYSSNSEDGAGVTCWVDKNVYFDTSGDGIKNNDHDLENTNCTSGTFNDIPYESSWGPIVMMLTVENEQGDVYQVTREIVFDIETGGTNILPVSSTGALVLIIVACSFALLGTSIYTIKKIN